MKIPSSNRVFPYVPACLLRVTGADAASFLQGQFTNDLRQIAPGQAVYGLWLDRKGHVVGDSNVVRIVGGGGFWVASISSPAVAIAPHLEQHIVADDVAVADETRAWKGIALIGEGAGDWLAGERRAGLVFPGRRGVSENWEWIFPEADSASAAAAVAGARIADAAEIERMRITSGIPSVPTDIGPADLPNEGGLDLQAVSYSKGCYLGQEVMARIKSSGRVRRTLVRVKGRGAPPATPAGLWRGEKREGELRSAVPDAGGYAGLALVSVACVSAGDPLSLAQGAAPTVEIERGA